MKKSKFKIGDRVRITWNNKNYNIYNNCIAHITEIIPRCLPDYNELPDNYNYKMNIEYKNQILKNMEFSSLFIRTIIDRPEYMK